MELDMRMGLKYLEFYENMDEVMDFAKIRGLIEDNVDDNNTNDSLMKEIEQKIHSNTEINIDKQVQNINDFIVKNFDSLNQVKEKSEKTYQIVI